MCWINDHHSCNLCLDGLQTQESANMIYFISKVIACVCTLGNTSFSKQTNKKCWHHHGDIFNKWMTFVKYWQQAGPLLAFKQNVIVVSCVFPQQKSCPSYTTLLAVPLACCSKQKYLHCSFMCAIAWHYFLALKPIMNNCKEIVGLMS